MSEDSNSGEVVDLCGMIEQALNGYGESEVKSDDPTCREKSEI